MADPPRLMCELCDIHVNHEQALRAHLIGRRHQRALDRAAIAERSVYIRGFPPELVQEEDLRELFQQFGTITNIALDMQKKWFAILEFSDVASALCVLRLPPASLELYGKKLVVRPREGKPLQQRRPPASEEHSSSGDGEGQQPMEMEGRTAGSTPLHKEMEGGAAGSTPLHKEMEGVAAESTPLHKAMEGGATGSTPLHIGGMLLPQGTAAKLQQVKSIGEQMEVLSSGCRLPEATLKAHLSLCHELQSLFRRYFPKCMLVPFGSPVSGFAMVTSDCDLCLLPHPSEEDVRYFSPESYFSPELLAVWRSVSPELLAVWRSVSTSLSTDVSKRATPKTRFSQKNPHCPPEYDLVLAIVRKSPRCFKVHQVAFARVPIVSFSYQPTGIHCDISINNRLGPFNTRLMRAYFEFDGRVATLVPIVRLWIRASGINRAQLNSYAILLMLVYALQHSSPPVLPNLQAPGPWPRNMQWFASHGFAAAVPSPPITAGWKCGFTAPGTLMPSCSTATPAELLLHLFEFYSEQFNFSKHVVATHHTGSRLTIQQAIDKAARERAPTPRPGKGNRFKVGPLCIQDPFELTQNVAKNFSHSSMTRLKKHLTTARDTLRERLSSEATGSMSQTEAGLLAILDPDRKDTASPEVDQRSQDKAGSPECPMLTKLLHFTSVEIVSLLQRVESLQELGSSLTELDLSNSAIARRLAAVVLKALVLILKQEVNMDCTPVCASGPTAALLETFDTRQAQHASVCTATQGPKSDQTIPLAPDPSVSPQDQPTDMECDSVGYVGGVVTETIHKRQCVVACAGAQNPKRARLESEPQAPALDLLLSEAEGASLAYHCTAYSTTWVHRRQTRRATVLPVPSEKPVLEFLLLADDEKLVSMEPSDSPPLYTVLTVQLQATQSLYSKEFALFFAFFKKLVLYGC